MNIMAKIIAAISLNTIAHHIPIEPIIKGKINTKDTWNTNVLKKDIIADINPLFNAVK